jgi:signal transduction histidine kinase/ActR/RegA family two-component response regulator
LNSQPADGAARPKLWRSPIGVSLPTRLLALFLLCLLPVLAVEITTNIDLRARQQAELGDLAMRQSELASGDMASLVDGTERLMQTIARFASVRAHDPACGADLVALQQQMPEYTFLAVLGPDDAVLCASRPDIGGIAPGQRLGWATAMGTGDDLAVGRRTVLPGGDAFLPITLAIPASSAEPPSARAASMIVAAVDLGWLGRHLAGLWLSRMPLQADSTVVVTDTDGTVLSRYPEDAAWLGQSLPNTNADLVGGVGPGIAPVRLPDGTSRLAAYVPATVPPVGLATVVFVSAQAVASRLEISGTHEILLVAGAALIALILTLIAARRMFVRPMALLLQAAQRWHDGDLGARADIGESRSEFGRLAASFNRMASALQLRDAERRTQAEMLEAQVLARTRALSDTNNRLQVEIAEREKIEAALRQAQKRQALGQLAGGIAHDFNNMLATILGNLDLMERRLQTGALGGNSEEIAGHQALIERASEAVQSGAQLTSRLLAFSRRQRLAVGPTDLNRLIIDLLSLAASSLGRGVTVRHDLAPDLWPALADASQVEAALLNLCLNARDAMPNGGVLTITTDHETIADAGPAAAPPRDLPPGDYVRVTVSDTGHGMTPDVLAHAIEPFFTTKGPAGSGLGLSQVYGLARQSAGTVHIVSAPNQGTRVALLLRRAPEPTAPAGSDDFRTAPQPLIPKLRLMVVDDDDAVRRVTVDILQDLGCDVVEASCADEALALLDAVAADIDVLLIDYMMPGRNGIELARAVRDEGVAVSLVLATGYAELEDKADAYAALFDGMLRKPFTITQLHAILLRLHRRAHPDTRAAPLHGELHL